jgi:hypothetical protein
MKSNIIWFSVFVLIIIVCCLMWWQRNRATEGYSLARIMQDGVVIKEIDLNSVDEPYEFVIKNDSGESNTVSVQRGKIAVVDADCCDKICVNTGYISTGAAPIVCLPHKLTIMIVDDSDTSGIDAVAGNR